MSVAILEAAFAVGCRSQPKPPLQYLWSIVGFLDRDLRTASAACSGVVLEMGGVNVTTWGMRPFVQ